MFAFFRAYFAVISISFYDSSVCRNSLYPRFDLYFWFRVFDSKGPVREGGNRTAMNICFATKTPDEVKRNRKIQMSIVDFVKFVQNVRNVLDEARNAKSS
ncbi:unnamed protein product [Enterobius vermicularis]|uniref:COMM domain-containing protein n=1 Tax=Enterobius vermicularis TaxID=51028 RepID=A0A0N4V9D9_ENTVE|nr:unnamed protein product [Enterobius vermicularis]